MEARFLHSRNLHRWHGVISQNTELFRLGFGRFPVRITAETATNRNDVFRDSPHSTHPIAGRVGPSKLHLDVCLPHSFQIIIRQSSCLSPVCVAWNTDTSVKKPKLKEQVIIFLNYKRLNFYVLTCKIYKYRNVIGTEWLSIFLILWIVLLFLQRWPLWEVLKCEVC
jgi:hypothetical protein